VDTLKSLGGHPVLILGADQYAKLETWHRWRDVLELAALAVVARPGSLAPGGQVRQVPMAPMDISASDIRARVARGQSIAGLVPAAVQRYIEQHRLYGHP
jgi:nicotinate-nucleotide adenylyltransferase